jgi:hypothetical protein
MKKHFYLLTVGLLTACISYAQVKKGDVLVGGNIGFFKQDVSPGQSGNDLTSFSIYPSIGKAIRDDLVVGLNLGYAHSRTKSVTSDAYITTQVQYSLGAYIRRYKNLGAGFALFGEGDLLLTYGLYKSYYDGGPKPPASKSYSIRAGLYPGIAYFLSRRVQVETGFQDIVNVQYLQSGFGADKSNSVSLNANLNKAFDNFVVGFKLLL